MENDEKLSCELIEFEVFVGQVRDSGKLLDSPTWTSGVTGLEDNGKCSHTHN